MLFGILLLFYPLIYYFTHDAARYRHPIDPLVILLAVNGAARLTGWGQGATKNA
jgi:hypothetical protein